MGRTDPKELTALERKFLLLYAEHRYNGTETAMAMCPRKFKTRHEATVYASDLFKGIKAKLGTGYWAALGLDDERIARVYREATDAEIVKVFCHEGSVIESERYVDHYARLKAAEGIAKLRGLNAPDKVEHTGKLTLEELVCSSTKPDGDKE